MGCFNFAAGKPGKEPWKNFTVLDEIAILKLYVSICRWNFLRSLIATPESTLTMKVLRVAVSSSPITCRQMREIPALHEAICSNWFKCTRPNHTFCGGPAYIRNV